VEKPQQFIAIWLPAWLANMHLKSKRAIFAILESELQKRISIDERTGEKESGASKLGSIGGF